MKIFNLTSGLALRKFFAYFTFLWKDDIFNWPHISWKEVKSMRSVEAVVNLKNGG
jgi:hypothetical protein